MSPLATYYLPTLFEVASRAEPSIAPVAFTGDTLFCGGCGALFEASVRPLPLTLPLTLTLTLALTLTPTPTLIKALELGAGVGVSGIVLAELGARVTLTDCFPPILALLRRNVAQNAGGGLARRASVEP